MARGNRQILINPHSSSSNPPVNHLNLGEIAVQHDSVENASLWIETDDTSTTASTLVRFMNASAVSYAIEQAQNELDEKIEALSAGTIQLSADVKTYVDVLSAGTLHEITEINNAIGIPKEGADHFDPSQTVWSAINQTYEAVVASAAAATTYVVEGDEDDTKKFLKIEESLDQDSSARTYTVDLSGITEAIDEAWDSAHTEIQELSAATIQLSGDVVTYVNELSAGTLQLSADTYNTINSLSGVVTEFSSTTNTKISELSGIVESLSAFTEDLDFSGVTPNAGQAIVNVTQEDGKVSAELGDIAAEHVTVADTAGKLTADNVEDALSEIVDMVEGATDLKITAVTPSSTNVKEEYALVDSAGTALGDHIKIYKDSSLYQTYLGHVDDTISSSTDPTVIAGSGDTALCFIYQKADGTYELVAVDVSKFLEETEFKSGVTATDHIVHGVVDPQSEAFLTVGANGFKLSGVQDAIDAAKASATTKVVEGTDAGNNMTIVPTTGADGSVTYTVNLTDVASKTGLDNEISARTDADTAIQNELDAVETAVGLASDGTYVEKTGTNYLDSATTVEGEISALDTALKAVSDKVTAMSVTEGSSTEDWVSLTVTGTGTEGQTAITINDSALNTELLRLSGAVDTERDERESADAELLGSTASTSAETSIMGLKALIEQLTDDLNDKAVQDAEFEVLTDAERDEDHCNAGIKVVDNDDNGKKVQLDLSLLKIDCGEY